MPSSAIKVLVLLAVMLVSPVFAAPRPLADTDDQSSTTATKKTANNPKKPATGKTAGSGDKVKTEDRMSTRGLKPPPKDAPAGKDKDKTAKPDAPPKP